VFERWLRAAGVDPERISGYDRVVGSHFAVAEAVASGLADAGPGVLPVARAYGLGFLPLGEQRYDLVIPQALLSSHAVRVFLDVLTSRAFRRELEAIGGYDPEPGGAVRTLR
jgi:molybdate-binding protein